MKKSHVVVVLIAVLTCALLVFGIVSATHPGTSDTPLSVAGAPPAGAAPAVITTAASVTTTTAP